MTRRILPFVAALTVLFLLALSIYTAVAGADGEDQAWALGHEAGSLSPLPLGAGSIPVVVGALEVAGQSAGGSWDGAILRASSRDPDALFHELGHAFDDRDLDAAERGHLLELMGYPLGTPWQNADRWTSGDVFCLRLACPNERFADLFMGCSLGYRLMTSTEPVAKRGVALAWWSDGWKMTVGNYSRLCRALWRYSA